MTIVNVGKQGLYETLKADMLAMGKRRPGIVSMIYYFFIAPDFLAVLLYRLSSASVNKGIFGKIISIILWRLNVFMNGCDIDPEARIGEGFNIAHPAGIVVGRAHIGRNLNLFQNVTLGRDRTHGLTDTEYFPLIGNNVDIYAGAVVVGGVRIGSGASIGANAVVLRDVPDDCLAVGVPARILEKRKAPA